MKILSILPLPSSSVPMVFCVLFLYQPVDTILCKHHQEKCNLISIRNAIFRIRTIGKHASLSYNQNSFWLDQAPIFHLSFHLCVAMKNPVSYRLNVIGCHDTHTLTYRHTECEICSTCLIILLMNVYNSCQISGFNYINV